MKKFDQWNILKKKVNAQKGNVFVRPREVWYAHIWVNVGNEEDGKGTTFQRPVLVIKKVGNLFFVAPLTTKGRDSIFYYTFPHEYFSCISRVILSQAKMVDKKRLTDKLFVVDTDHFICIKEKLKALLL